MLEFAKNNHFHFGYSQKAFETRRDWKQKFWVNYSRKCEREPLDWRSECILSAKEIAARAGSDLRVCLSGGIDSEIVAESFRYARIPFQVTIMRMKNNLNIHDISWAIRYCETFDIPYNFIDIDVHEYLNSGELLEISREAQCVAPGFAYQLKLFDVMWKDGLYPVSGAGDCWFFNINFGINPSPNWNMLHSEIFLSNWRFQIARKKPGALRFFQWSPEIVQSFLLNPMIDKLLKGENSDLRSHMILKHDMCAQYFPIERRQKYTGFEKFAALNLEIQNLLLKELGPYNSKVFMPIFQVVKMLSPKPASIQKSLSL